MTKLKKYIMENGNYIGSGASRTVYELKGKVYKVIHERYDNYNQNTTEIENLQYIRETFGNLNILLDIKGINAQVNITTLVDYVADDDMDYYDWCESQQDDDDYHDSSSIYSYLTYCETRTDFKHFNAKEEIDLLLQANINDIDTNSGNFGYHQGYIKIIDLGLC